MTKLRIENDKLLSEQRFNTIEMQKAQEPMMKKNSHRSEILIENLEESKQPSTGSVYNRALKGKKMSR